VDQYRAQLRGHQPENYGFASMSSIPVAHGAAYDLRKEHPKGMTITLVPNPNDIVSDEALEKYSWLTLLSSGRTLHFRSLKVVSAS